MQWNVLKLSRRREREGEKEWGLFTQYGYIYIHTDSEAHMIDFLLRYKSCTALPWNTYLVKNFYSSLLATFYLLWHKNIKISTNIFKRAFLNIKIDKHYLIFLTSLFQHYLTPLYNIAILFSIYSFYMASLYEILFYDSETWIDCHRKVIKIL